MSKKRTFYYVSQLPTFGDLYSPQGDTNTSPQTFTLWKPAFKLSDGFIDPQGKLTLPTDG